jgi:prepilin peptidase CpaA
MFMWWIFAILVAIIGLVDLKTYTIPNLLTIPGMFLGMLFSFLEQSWPGLGWSAGGIFTGFFLLMPAYLAGGLGAGDVKFLMMIGSFVFPKSTLEALLLALLAASVFIIGLAYYQRKAGALLRAIWSNTLNILRFSRSGQSQALSLFPPLPFGFFLALGVLLMSVLPKSWRFFQ